MRPRSLAWAGFAASAWAIAYAIGVRVYQGLGGRLGLAGTFQDPAAMWRASLMAGVGILLAVLGVILSSSAQFAWDLLFYEPWFLGLGVLVTLGTLHYNRRSGGSVRAGRRLVTITAAATLVLTLFSCTLVVASNA
jgi:hypothetical protein